MALFYVLEFLGLIWRVEISVWEAEMEGIIKPWIRIQFTLHGGT
jgi:hypothetical protein